MGEQRMCLNCDYLKRRAEEERNAAIVSAHPRARQCHIDLAEAYERQVRTFAAEERRSALHLVSEEEF
jgi:hypothetical protein